MPARVVGGDTSARHAASTILGVMRVTIGARWRKAPATSPMASESPLVAASTGSRTSADGRYSARRCAKISTISGAASMPIFTAAMLMSAKSASICAATNSAGTTWMPATPCVFCAVSAVIAARPWQRNAANVLMSARTPAAPLGSKPAIDRTLGIMSRYAFA